MGHFPPCFGIGKFPFPPGRGVGNWKLEKFQRALGLENFRFHLGVGLEIGNWKNYNLLWAWIISVSRQVGVEN